jgi:hypothetical protein
MQPLLPRGRGPLCDALFARWGKQAPLDLPILSGLDPLTDDDLHTALWCCYQLHFGGFADVDDRMEWDGPTLGFRADLEAAFETALWEEHQASSVPRDPVTALRVIAAQAGPPLSTFIEESGERWHLQEYAVHRSAYQLKEADGHTFALPRLRGPGRGAMVEIQADEYGMGRPGAAHSELFARAMDELGLDSELGSYVDRLPGTTLATDNLVSLFGLHLRLRGAAVGHLALFELCSVVPMSRYLAAARRVGDLPALARFYEVHVDADVHHARLALDQMVAPMAEADPGLAPMMVFGAAALGRTEARFARHVLGCWQRGESSLCRELAKAG